LGSDITGFYSLYSKEADIVTLKLNWECGWFPFNCAHGKAIAREVSPRFSLLGSVKNYHWDLSEMWHFKSFRFCSYSILVRLFPSLPSRISIPGKCVELDFKISSHSSHSIVECSNIVGSPPHVHAPPEKISFDWGLGTRLYGRLELWVGFMKQIFKSACVAARITSTAVMYSAKLVPTVLILEYGYVEE